jgi:hypothetical protein
MSKGRKGRTPDQIRHDRAEIARLYLQRYTQAEIGQQLGLSRQQVGYDLDAVRAEWLQSSLMDFNARKAEELARIDRLEREYWTAWEASQQGRETTTTGQTTDPRGERVKAEIRKEEQHGDPRYLAGVQWCISKRCEILGFNAPTRNELTGKDGGPIQFESLNDADLDRRIADLEARIRGTAGREGASPTPVDASTGEPPAGLGV